MLKLFILVACGCAETIPGSIAAAHRMQAAQDREAERDANDAARRRTERENAEIRRTGEQLERTEVRPRGSAQPIDTSLPENLSRSMVNAGISSVKSSVMACSKPSTRSQVTVAVKVAPDGRVSAVDVTGTPDQEIGNCVGTAVFQATFEKTQRGGSFRYPFTL